MNRLRKLAAVVLSAATLMASSAVPALAANSNYQALQGQDVVLHKYLILDETANVPNVTFNYTFEAGAAVAATPANGNTPGTLQVNAGDDASRVTGTIAPTLAPVAFTAADTPVATPTPEITVPAGKKVITKDITIPFSDLTYNEPGVYRYIVTEVDGGAQGITYDTVGNGNLVRTIDVYIEDNGSGVLTRTGVIVYEGAVTDAPSTAGTDLATKRPYYVNEYTSYDLTLEKDVTGNQGSKDEYFQFTVTINNAVAGTVYNVVGSFDTTTTTNGVNTQTYTNPTSITVPTGATSVTQVFWLQDGQNITIQGIAAETSYSIGENYAVVTAEGYSIDAAAQGDTTDFAYDASTAVASDTGLNDDTTVTFTNDKEGAVPTGVLVSATPVIIVGVVLLAGIAALVVVSSKRKAAEAAEAETDEN